MSELWWFVMGFLAFPLFAIVFAKLHDWLRVCPKCKRERKP